MEQNQGTLKGENNCSKLCVAFELANTKWKLAFSDGTRVRQVTIEARNLVGLRGEIDRAKKRFRSEGEIKVWSCYEAGRDGFWLHRWLGKEGIENLVVDSSSIEVSRRRRRAQTDRWDARKLLEMLIRYHGGERKIWSGVRVPPVEEEDGWHLQREMEVLNQERTRHRNRIQALLIQLPLDLGARVEREYERLWVVEEQMKRILREREERLEGTDAVWGRQVRQLRRLYGIWADEFVDVCEGVIGVAEVSESVAGGCLSRADAEAI